MDNYSNYHGKSVKERLKSTTEKLFYMQYRTGEEGYEVKINGTFTTDGIIQRHVNPKNELLTDKKLLFLRKDLENIHWGSMVESSGLESPYMVVTEPVDNEMYASCVIRKANNKAVFSLDGKSLTYDAILHVGRVYLEQSYTNETVVFADEDMRALIIPYDKNTNQLRIFNEVVVDDVIYSVVKVDDSVLRENGSEHGVIQIVLLKQAPATLILNFESEITGILRFARLKERVYNSNARELLTLPNAISTGDYVSHNFKDNDIRTYIVRSMIDEMDGFDRTFMLICQKEFKFLDKQGNVVIRPVSFSDTRTKMNEKDTWFVVQDTSAVEGYMKFDDKTAQIAYTDVDGVTDYVPNRFIVDGLAYRVVGTDRLSMAGLMTVKLVMDKIDANFDNLELGIADYYRFYPRDTQEESMDIIGESIMHLGESRLYSLANQNMQSGKWELIDTSNQVKLSEIEKGVVQVSVPNSVKLIGNTIGLKYTVGSQVLTKDIGIVGW